MDFFWVLRIPTVTWQWLFPVTLCFMSALDYLEWQQMEEKNRESEVEISVKHVLWMNNRESVYQQKVRRWCLPVGLAGWYEQYCWMERLPVGYASELFFVLTLSKVARRAIEDWNGQKRGKIAFRADDDFPFERRFLHLPRFQRSSDILPDSPPPPVVILSHFVVESSCGGAHLRQTRFHASKSSSICAERRLCRQRRKRSNFHTPPYRAWDRHELYQRRYVFSSHRGSRASNLAVCTTHPIVVPSQSHIHAHEAGYVRLCHFVPGLDFLCGVHTRCNLCASLRGPIQESAVDSVSTPGLQVDARLCKVCRLWNHSTQQCLHFWTEFLKVAAHTESMSAQLREVGDQCGRWRSEYQRQKNRYRNLRNYYLSRPIARAEKLSPRLEGGE